MEVGITRYYLNTCRLLRQARTGGVRAVFPATAPLVPLAAPVNTLSTYLQLSTNIYCYLHWPMIVPVKVRTAVVGDVVPVQPGEGAAAAAAVAGLCIWWTRGSLVKIWDNVMIKKGKRWEYNKSCSDPETQPGPSCHLSSPPAPPPPRPQARTSTWTW